MSRHVISVLCAGALALCSGAALAGGAARTRRGLRPEGRAPIREGVEIFDAAEGGNLLGKVCSGGFGPSAGGPIAMAILPADLAEGASVWAELRGKRMAVTLSALPFHKPSYKLLKASHVEIHQRT